MGGTPLKLNFVAPNDTVASSKFTRFVHYQMKELRQSELDARALINGAVKVHIFTTIIGMKVLQAIMVNMKVE